MKKMMMVLAIVIGCVLSVMAQSAQIDKIWVDHNVYENSNKGMRIHVKFDIRGLKNQKGYVCAYFFNDNKNKLIRYNDGYRSPDGNVSVGKEITPSYDNSTYSDFKLFMPYYVFDNYTSGLYYFYIEVFSHISNNYNTLIKSEYQGFTYTIGTNNNVVNNNSIELTYTERVTCEQCKGSGKCMSCHGSGTKGSVYTRQYGVTYVKCSLCNGTGKCTLFGCGGIGYKTYTRNYTSEQLNSKGVTAWDNGNYNNAFKYFQKSADYSYAWGMYNLGQCYELGRGCEKSRAMAIHWYKKAANNNNEEAIKALDRLGVDYNPDGGYANNSNSVIINPSKYPNNYNNTRTCYRCKGSGKCEECYGGKCKNCIGDGYYYYNTYGKVTCNASHEGAQRCSQCYGRGYCPTCNGSNKCQVCSGRGELTN